MNIELIKKNTYKVSFRYNTAVVEILRKQIKRKFDYNSKNWIVSLNGFESKKVFLELLYSFKWNLINCNEEINEIIDFVVNKEAQIADNEELSKSKESDFNVDGLNFKLYPFQKSGVEYLVKNKKVILGDTPGLGKTMQSLAAIHHLKAYPNLTICPNTLKLNWKRELEKWLPNIKVLILDSADDISIALSNNFDFLVCNYHTVTKYHKELKIANFKSMIIDESHMIKSSKTKRTKAVTYLSKKIDIVFELTGTAVSNRPNELISQLNVLGTIDDFGGSWNFLMKYCAGKKGQFGWDFSGSSNIEELHKKLRKLCYIRREAEEVLVELPDISSTEIEIEITNRAEYNRAERDLIKFLKGFQYKEEAVIDWVKKEYKEDWEFLDSKKKKEYYKIFKESKISSARSAEHLVKINVLRQLVAKGKKTAIIEWVENFLESDNKLVLFGFHNQLLLEVADYFKVTPITGGTSIEDRQEIIDDFQDNLKTKLIVLNTKIGGVGITLTAAHHLAFMEMGWTPGEHDQCERRIYRIGQKNHSNIYYLLGNNTLDLDLHQLVNEKRIITDAVNKGVESKKEIKILNELIKRIQNRN